MRTMNASFVTALSEDLLKITELYVIELASGVTYYFTHHTKNIIWDAEDNVYESIAIKRGPIEHNSNLEADTVDIEMGGISGDFYNIVHSNILDGARITIKRIRWDDTYASDKEMLIFIGDLNVSFDRSVIKAVGKSLYSTLNIQIPRHVYQEPCVHCLFDDGCGLTQANYKVTGTATTGTRRTMTDATRNSVCYSVPFDNGDSANPINVGESVVAPYNFAADTSCKALYRFESGALGTDSKGTNNLSNTGVAEDTVNYKEGGCSGLFATADYMSISDLLLNPGFPLKSGDTNKKISVTFWVKFTSLPAPSNSFWMVTKYVAGVNGRSFGVLLDNTAGVVKFKLAIGYGTGGSTEYLTEANTTVVSGKWYHVGATFQNSDKSWKIRVYDATEATVVESSGTTTNNIYISGSAFQLGRITTYGYHQGNLDEVGVFSEILSSDEIDTIRQGSLGAAAIITGIVYETATTGYVTYTLNTGVIEDNTILSHGAHSVTVNGTPTLSSTFYKYGELKMTSGNNNGFRRQIWKDEEGVITVLNPFPFEIQMGDTYEIYAGCDKKAETCRDYFNNTTNFEGYIYIPKVEDTFYG